MRAYRGRVLDEELRASHLVLVGVHLNAPDVILFLGNPLPAVSKFNHIGKEMHWYNFWYSAWSASDLEVSGVNLRMCVTACRIWLGPNFPVFGEVSGVKISYLQTISTGSFSSRMWQRGVCLCISVWHNEWIHCAHVSPLEELVKRSSVSKASSSHSHVLLQPEVLALVQHLHICHRHCHHSRQEHPCQHQHQQSHRCRPPRHFSPIYILSYLLTRLFSQSRGLFVSLGLIVRT